MSNYYNRQWRLPNNENKDKQSNYSMDFDGASTQYIDTNFTGLNNVSTATISAWMNIPVFTNLYALGNLQIDSGTYKGIGFNPSTSTALVYVNNNTSGAATFTFNPSSYYSAGNWFNIVFVFDGSESGTDRLKVYIDKNLVTGTWSGTPLNVLETSTSNFLIGNDGQQAAPYFTGKIDGVSIYNYALSSSQITTLYGSSSTGIGNPMSLSPKPVAYYPLGDQDVFNSSSYLVPNSSLKDYVFNGGASSNYVFNSNINQANTGGKFTVSFWAKNASSLQVSFSHGTGNYEGSFEQLAGKMIVWLAASVYQYFIYPTPDPRTDGKWHHYVVYVDTNTTTDSEVWIDKVQMTKGSGGNGTINAFTSGFTFKPFTGDVSNMMYFTNYEIDQTNVNVLYNNGSPITSTSGLSTAPDHWWKLNAADTYDGSNWTIEDHVGSNDGTSSGLTQSALEQSDLSFKTSISNFAFDFDGTNDYIDFGNNSSLNISTSSYSISFWIKTNDSGITVISQKANDELAVWINNSKIQWNGANPLSSNSQITGNVWKHVCLVTDSSSSYIYINGAEDATGSTQINSTTSSDNFRIGGRNTQYSYDGQLSNWAIWNTPLTSSQVTEIYSEGIPQNLNNHSAISSLISWWQLGSNSSFNTNWTVLDEVTASGNNGVSANMTEASIVDGVNSYANGLSSGMSDAIVGDAPYSTANSLSVNMDVLDRTDDTPS